MSLWHRTGPAALLAVGSQGSQGSWGGTAPHLELWLCGSAWSLAGVSCEIRDYCNKVEVVWTVEVMLAQTSPGTAFLSIATKDSAVRK